MNIELMQYNGYQITVDRRGMFYAQEIDAESDPLEAETLEELKQKISRLEENKARTRKKAPADLSVRAWIYGTKGTGYRDREEGWFQAVIRRVGIEKSSFRSREPILLVTIDGEKTAIQSRREWFSVAFPDTDDEKRLVPLLDERAQLKARLEELEDEIEDANKWLRMPVKAINDAEDAPIAQAELVEWLNGQGQL